MAKVLPVFKHVGTEAQNFNDLLWREGATLLNLIDQH